MFHLINFVNYILLLGLNWKSKPPDSDIRRNEWILANPATELY